MSSHKYLYLFAFIFLGSWFAAGNVCADQPETDTSTNVPAFRASLKSEEVVGGTKAKPVQRAYLTSGTNKFAFLVPADFRVDASFPNKVVLNSPDYGCFISVRFIAAGPPETGAVPIESWRNQALSEFPNATLSNQFSINAANHSGPAYELQWTNPGGTDESACAAFVPFAAGVLEFSLLTHSNKYPDGKYFFHSLLLSLQCNESGKFEILPLPGNS
jgi:hypothetical protein